MKRLFIESHMIKYDAEHKAGNAENADQGDIAHRRTRVFEKGHTSGIQITQANSSTKNVTVTKRCGAKSNSHDSIHDEIE